MGTISRSTKTGTGTTAFGGGTIAYASEVNSDFNTVYACVNGNITNVNVNSSANISSSKLNLSSITQDVALNGDLDITGNVDISGNVTISGTLTADITGINLTTDVTGILPIANGGTGTTSLTDIGLPTQTGNSGKYLTTNGSVSSWGVITSKSLGAPSSKDADTVYQATTDGFVTIRATAGAQARTLDFRTDGSNPPTTVYAYSDIDAFGSTNFCVPVKSGNYYKATASGSFNTFTMFFVPLS